MKVIYFNQEKPYNLSVDYKKMMSDGWSRRMKEFIRGKEMSSIMYEVNTLYRNKNVIMFPPKKDIFRVMNELDVTEVNVAIINCNVQFNYRSNGIAFGNKSLHRGDIDLSLSNLFDKINTYERRVSSHEDYTLDHWLEQYVFLYNVALTGFTKYSQETLWREFSRNVIEIISRARQGVIFLFVGSEEQCKPYIEKVNHQKHTILRHDTLSYDALEEINLEIDCINGKDYRIKW